MLSKPTISLKLAEKTDGELLTFSNTIAAGLNGNLNYTTPSPTLIDFGSDITDFSDALTAWGSVGNRGSHVQNLAVVEPVMPMRRTERAMRSSSIDVSRIGNPVW
jgi:hypothetical protein